MKGDGRLVERLNALVADELTAINEYMVHSEMCAAWGYEALHQATEARAIQEMKHAEALIGRILFLEGSPAVGSLNRVDIGADVQGQLRNDLSAEEGAVGAYNADIALAREVADTGTAEMLTSILKDEEEHYDWLEVRLDQIQQLGIQTYLTVQLGSGDE